MISCDKYRATIEITLSDIFSDFNDSRKEVLMRRVKLALEDLQIRMRNEVQTNNLANLQMLLKKQQALKKMEDKVKQITDEIEEKRERDHYLSSKIAELQAELNKSTDAIKAAQEKMKNSNELIAQRDAQLALKDEEVIKMGKQLQEVQKQNQRVEMERQKLEEIIKRLHNTYHHKTQETQLILKIKEKRLEETMNESITNLQIRNQREKEKMEIENKLKTPKIEKKNQKIQVSIVAPSPVPNTSRIRESQLTSRQSVRNFVDKEAQTEATQEAKIVQFIDSTPPKKEEKLEEIRLVYTTTPKFLPTVNELPPPVNSPKITKIYDPQTVEASMQTNPVVFKPPTPTRLDQTCQAFIDDQSGFFESIQIEIENLKTKYVKMEQFHDQRYWQLLRIYQERPSLDNDLKQIELLNLTILELKLQLSKKDKEMADQRELYAKVANDLHQGQNNSFLKKLSMKIGDPNLIKKPKLNQTCSFFNTSSSPKRIQTQLSQGPADDPENDEDDLLMATYHTTKIKLPSTAEDLITVFKSKNSVKYRRHSLKTSLLGNEAPKDRPKISRDYQKYSRLKITNIE